MTLQLLLWTLLAARPYAGPEAVTVPAHPAPATDLVLDVREPRGALGPLVWASDNRSVWVAGGSIFHRIDADTGAVLTRLAIPGGEEPEAAVISPRGTHIATITADSITVWDSTGKITLHASRKGWMLDELVTFSADGRRVFAAFYNDDEQIRIEAWDVASGRSLGTRRIREVSDGSDSEFEFTPVRLAGSHVFFDDLILLARPRPIRTCADSLPAALAGDLAWYDDGAVRHIDDCNIVHARTPALTAIKTAQVELSARADRAAYVQRDEARLTLGLIDLAADAELGRLEFAGIKPSASIVLAPDGSQVAAALRRRGADDQTEQLLLLWRPLPVGAAPARLLTLRVPTR